MSQEHPDLLYVGDVDYGRALADAVEREGSMVYVAEDVMEALAMYVHYLPDVIVVDKASEPVFAAEVYEHLLSVHASPMIVLSEEPQPYEPGVYVLPAGINLRELITAAQEIRREQEPIYG